MVTYSNREILIKQTAKYPSRYSPNKLVTAGQYILELICEKRAQYLKRDLPIKFWELPEWKQYFQSQARKCHQLLAEYHPDAIISALRDKRMYSVYSLHAKWMVPIIEEYNKKILAGQKNQAESVPLQIAKKNGGKRPHFQSKNIVDKLQDLE